MQPIKNKKRITNYSEFIENYTKNLITTSENVVSVELNYDSPVTFNAAKTKIRSFFEKLRSAKVHNEYLVVTNLKQQIPKHNLILDLNCVNSKFEEFLKTAWKNSDFVRVEKEESEKYANIYSDYYLDAAESIPLSNINSKQVKSKIFHRSRIKTTTGS